MVAAEAWCSSEETVRIAPSYPAWLHRASNSARATPPAHRVGALAVDRLAEPEQRALDDPVRVRDRRPRLRDLRGPLLDRPARVVAPDVLIAARRHGWDEEVVVVERPVEGGGVPGQPAPHLGVQLQADRRPPGP